MKKKLLKDANFGNLMMVNCDIIKNYELSLAIIANKLILQHYFIFFGMIHALIRNVKQHYSDLNHLLSISRSL